MCIMCVVLGVARQAAGMDGMPGASLPRSMTQRRLKTNYSIGIFPAGKPDRAYRGDRKSRTMLVSSEPTAPRSWQDSLLRGVLSYALQLQTHSAFTAGAEVVL